MWQSGAVQLRRTDLTYQIKSVNLRPKEPNGDLFPETGRFPSDTCFALWVDSTLRRYSFHFSQLRFELALSVADIY